MAGQWTDKCSNLSLSEASLYFKSTAIIVGGLTARRHMAPFYLDELVSADDLPPLAIEEFGMAGDSEARCYFDGRSVPFEEFDRLSSQVGHLAAHRKHFTKRRLP